MKILSILFATLFLISSAFTQEMKLKYEIKITSDNPEMQFALQMAEGASLTIYAKDDKSRTEMSMGQLMSTTTILDMGKKKGLQIMDGMIGKQAAIIEGSDFEQFNKSEDQPEIEYVDESKTILGYKCKKAVVYLDEGAEMVFWYTNDLKISPAYLGEYSKMGMKGIPLEYGVDQGEMKMKFIAKEVKTSIKEDGLFDLSIPEGYTEKSFKEISNMSGQ